MMSSEDERRLAAIERQMFVDDPDFVRWFRRRVSGSMRAQRIRAAVRGVLLCALWSVVGIGAALAVIGIISGLLEVVLPGCVLVGASLWSVHVLRRRWRRAG